METMEIINNDEVIKAAEEYVKGFKVGFVKSAIGVGAFVLVGVATYKYVVKPTIAKIKAKKEQRETEAAADNFTVYEDDIESDEN